MKKDEKQYADELVRQYEDYVYNLEPCHYEVVFSRSEQIENSVKCAINDVTNTMKALNEQYIEIWGKSKDWKYTEHNTYYQTVLQILKERL